MEHHVTTSDPEYQVVYKVHSDFKHDLPKRIIIDCDPGADDAQALILATHLSKKFDCQILGVTITDGNAELDQTYKNAKLTLSMCGCANIPVLKGDKLTVEKDTDMFYGADGLGGMYEKYASQYQFSPNEIEEKQSAFQFLLEQSHLYPGEITIICLAPLTNIAHTVKEDPSFPERIKNIIILGGNYSGKGNAYNCTSEFNFNNDPEAARVAVTSFKDTTIVPLEILYEYMLHEEDRLDETFNQKTAKGKFVSDTFQHSREIFQGYPIGDPIAVCVAFYPDYVKQYIYKQVQVETTGELTKGLLAINWTELKHKMFTNKAKIVTCVDWDFLLKELIDSVKD